MTKAPRLLVWMSLGSFLAIAPQAQAQSTPYSLGYEDPVTPEPAPDEAVDEEAPTDVPTLEIALKAGGHFPQPFSDLGVNFDGILKLGYGVALQRQLQVFVELGYSQPVHTVDRSDPRLGGTYASEMTVRDLSTTLGVQYFIQPPSAMWVPFVGAGLQAHFLRSEVKGEGNAAAPFGDTDETSTQIGGVLTGGLGLHLGPGLLLGELRFNFVPVNQKVTGDSNVGALAVLLGYGLLF